MFNATTVYIIDSQGNLGNALRALLNHYDIQVTVFPDVTAFLSSIKASDVDNACLLIASGSDCDTGVPLVSNVRASKATLPIIVLCDTLSDGLITRYADAGASDVVSKSMVDAYVFTRLSELTNNIDCLPQTPAATMRARDGTPITIRMMTPDDSEMERRFVTALSEKSRYLRFFSGFKELPEYVLKQLVNIRFPVSYALIATVATKTGVEQIGVARYAPTKDPDVAEFAVVVADKWQGHGIATQLLRGVFTAATLGGISRIEGMVLRQNTKMLRLAKKMRFVVSHDEKHTDATAVTVFKTLRA